MSAVQFLHLLRRGVAPLAVGVCLAPAPSEAWFGSALPRLLAPPGPVVLAQAGGAPISPHQEPAPSLFEATGTAVWDGRRTLQGVWIAHPLAPSARRVRIYNVDTGAAVDGALFKRDPALTGPTVLVSSEAAQFLGMSPGDETDLRIVALTPSQQPEAKPAAAGEQDQAIAGAAAADSSAGRATDGQAAAGDDAGGSALEPAAVVVPAPRPDRRADSAPGATAEAEPRTSAEPATATAAAPPSATVIPTDRARETAAARPRFQPAPSGDASERPAGPSAERNAAEPATGAIMEPASDATAAAPSRPVFQSAPAVPAPQVSRVGASTAAPAAEAPGRDDPEPAKETAETAAPDPSALAPMEVRPVVAAVVTRPEPDPSPGPKPPSPAAGALSQPYVQAGIFGVAENADRLIGRLRAADLPAIGKPIRLNGKPATRVLSGPFTAAAERDAALRTIRGMGLTDASLVAR